jgi:hypothetical protein
MSAFIKPEPPPVTIPRNTHKRGKTMADVSALAAKYGIKETMDVLLLLDKAAVTLGEAKKSGNWLKLLGILGGMSAAIAGIQHVGAEVKDLDAEEGQVLLNTTLGIVMKFVAALVG